MLIPHIYNSLTHLDITENQAHQLIDLLWSIKESEILRTEFTSITKDSLRQMIIESYAQSNTKETLNVPFENDDTISSLNLGNHTFDHIDVHSYVQDHQLDRRSDSLKYQEQNVSDNPTSHERFDAELGCLPEHTVERIGPYIDMRQLGKGGMGEVRQVYDPILKRHLAMKIVHPEFMKSQNTRMRFKEEAQVGAQLQHPNIIPIHDFGELPDGRLYFTMKQIKGREFSEYIQEVHQVTNGQWSRIHNGISFRQLIQIFHKVCETIAYAHSVGVLHRDLKPENIMIGGFGEVLVVDWGLAKLVDEVTDSDLSIQTTRSEKNSMATQVGMVAGTPAYMSPEQAEGKIDQLGPHSDIYTLGAILYEILSGNPPYIGTSALDIVEKVKSTQPPSLLTLSNTAKSINTPHTSTREEYESTIPNALIDICEKAMHRTISARYQKASDLAQDIVDWLEGAKKRDKALEAYSEATSINTEIATSESALELLWLQANKTIESNGFNTEESWELWVQIQQYQTQIEQLYRQYHNTLQGVLIYDSTLEDVHESLAYLLVKEIVSHVATGKLKEQEAAQERLNLHLSCLPGKIQLTIAQQLEEHINNDIILRRQRSGHFVGRQHIKMTVLNAIKEHSQLLSLIGPAGIGKTRLALEIIYELQSSEHNTYFCDLTNANSEMGIALYVAQSINVVLDETDPITHLGAHFSSHPTILILDNLEQVLVPVTKIINIWLSLASDLQIITTSRIKLGLPIENIVPVQQFTLLESLTLFFHKGQQAKPNFTIHKSTRENVVQLINQMDRLPLTIELSAARLNIFTVDEITQRLSDRFSLLRSRNKNTKTLQAALDWSWDLLSHWEQAALIQCSVFRGGFDVPAGESIIYRVGSTSPPIFDILQDLCDNSLLQKQRSHTGTLRFNMLTSIQEYSDAKLKEVTDNKDPLSYSQTVERHAAYYARYGFQDHLDNLKQYATPEDWKKIFIELDNFAIGLNYSNSLNAVHCCLASLTILSMKGPLSLGLELANQTLQQIDVEHPIVDRLRVEQLQFMRLSGRGRQAYQAALKMIELLEHNLNMPSFVRIKADILIEVGLIEETESNFQSALMRYLEAQNLYQSIEFISGIARTHLQCGKVNHLMGNSDVMPRYEKALALAKEHNLTLLMCDAFNEIGYQQTILGDCTLALESHHKALDIEQKIDDKNRIQKTLGNIAWNHLELGQESEARVLCEKALKIAVDTGHIRGQISHSIALGHIYLNMGKLSRAAELYNEALQNCKQIHNENGVGVALVCLADIRDEQGDRETAIRMYKEALKTFQNLGSKFVEGGVLGNLGMLYVNNNQLDHARTYIEQAIEISKELGNKKDLGLQTGCLGEIHSKLGMWEEAQQHLETAVEILKEIGYNGGMIEYSTILAWTYANQNQPDTALEMIETYETNVERHTLLYGVMLCTKAKILHILHRPTEVLLVLENIKQLIASKTISQIVRMQEHLDETKAYIDSHRPLS